MQHFSSEKNLSTGRITGVDHKIKHFACHQDFFVHEIPRIKYTQTALYPGIKHFSSYLMIAYIREIPLSMQFLVIWKYISYVLYVGFDAERNLCNKQNVLFYGHPRTRNYLGHLSLKIEQHFRVSHTKKMFHN